MMKSFNRKYRWNEEKGAQKQTPTPTDSIYKQVKMSKIKTKTPK